MDLARQNMGGKLEAEFEWTFMKARIDDGLEFYPPNLFTAFRCEK